MLGIPDFEKKYKKMTHESQQYIIFLNKKIYECDL